jgi:peptidoglycan/LPS O-acetylase OafA/YrhL
LWSLANEFWYYILFPLGIVALWPRMRASHRVICAVLFLAAAWFVRHGILQAFPIWLLGAALFKLKPPSFPPSKARYVRIAASLIYLPIFFVLARVHSLKGLSSDYFLGALTFALLWVILSAKQAYDLLGVPAVSSRR